MKPINLIAAIMAIFCFVINPISQTTLSKKEPVNSLSPGRWAVGFLIGGQVSPDYIGSLNIALKSHISRVFAIRLGVSTNLNSYDGNNLNDDRVWSYSQSNTNANIFLNFLFYTNPSKPFSFFAGVGPVYQYAERKSENNSSDIFSSSSRSFEKEWSMGGFGVLGAEWFPHSRFSITAEYNFSYTIGKSHGVSTYIYNQPVRYEVYTQDMDVKRLNLNIVKLGVSAYF